MSIGITPEERQKLMARGAILAIVPGSVQIDVSDDTPKAEKEPKPPKKKEDLFKIPPGREPSDAEIQKLRM